MKRAGSIQAKKYYAEYHGHRVDHLEKVEKALRPRNIVFLAGDSSLDNKHWLFPPGQVKEECNFDDDDFCGPLGQGYETILEPARGVKDVCYWFNDAAAGNASNYACLNCSVEESALCDRENGVLLPQDEFIRDNIRADDVLCLSIGGNDIALKPSKSTMAAIAALNFLTPQIVIEKWDMGIGKGHLGGLFKDQVAALIRALTSKTRPKLVIVCMIYYPCETGSGWADTLLNLLGYTKSPGKLQAIIDLGYREFTCKLGECFKDDPEGPLRILPVELSKILDSKDDQDYDNRVEPSVQGGFKMGHTLYQKMSEELNRIEQGQ